MTIDTLSNSASALLTTIVFPIVPLTITAGDWPVFGGNDGFNCRICGERA